MQPIKMEHFSSLVYESFFLNIRLSTSEKSRIRDNEKYKNEGYLDLNFFGIHFFDFFNSSITALSLRTSD